MATKWLPPKKVPTLEWLATNYRLPAEGADLPGPYNPDYVPYLWGVFAALDDESVRVVVMMKAAQIGWTFGLIGWISKRVDVSPSPMIAVFPKDGDARKFSDEKFTPSVKASPIINRLINVETSRKDGNRSLFKKFAGGFLSMMGSNSIGNVKSTPTPVVIIEEPDDTNENIKEQGDGIRLARERLKRWRDSKLVLGGTPSIAGVSRVEENIQLSDQRVLPITCHDCDEKHPLDWDNVTWMDRGDSVEHIVYGKADPDSAIYSCPHCGSAWDDWQRQQNILNTVKKSAADGDPFYGWTATAETTGGVAGFKELSELYVCIPGTKLADVVRDYLEAEHEADKGDQSARIVFVNSKLARTYEYASDAPEVEALESRAEDYQELTVPDGGLVLTAGVDVQHDRLAVTIWAWGRDEEMFLVYWGELYAKTNVNDKNDPVWVELNKLLFTPIKSVHGFSLITRGVSVDSGDGQTNDAVYHHVRKYQRQGMMATKGSSADYGQREIYSLPKKIDHKNKTKASKYGLQIYTIGTHKAKDLLIGDKGRITLTGRGPGRMHWYKGVRADFYEQLTAEVKAPHRNMRNKLCWQPKSGVRQEALDCTVGAVHAARALKLHIMSKAQWEALERKLMQQDLFSDMIEAPIKKESTQTNTRHRKRGGFVNDWKK